VGGVCRGVRLFICPFTSLSLSIFFPSSLSSPSREAERNKVLVWIAVIELNTLAPGQKDESSCGIQGERGENVFSCRSPEKPRLMDQRNHRGLMEGSK